MSPDAIRFEKFKAALQALCAEHQVCILASGHIDDASIYVCNDDGTEDADWLLGLENDLRTPL